MRLLTVLLAVIPLTGQAPKQKPVTPQATQIVSPVHQPSPRYQLVQLGEFRADQYLLDTHSGRMWQIVKGKDGGMVLQIVPFIDPLDEQALLPDDEHDTKKFALRIQYLKSTEKLFGTDGTKK